MTLGYVQLDETEARLLAYALFTVSAACASPPDMELFADCLDKFKLNRKDLGFDRTQKLAFKLLHHANIILDDE